jgi:thiosulfate dehydrogenase
MKHRDISPRLLYLVVAALAGTVVVAGGAVALVAYLLLGQAWPAPAQVGAAAPPPTRPLGQSADYWRAPDLAPLPAGPAGEQVRYGRELIANTATYFGPSGSVARTSNGMNCQNCHLEAGTKPWGNNYGAVAATFPRFRARSGTVESVAKRVNDCFARSLNGQVLDTTGREMRAIVAYLEWLGQGVPKGQKPAGTGLPELPYLDRAASPENGEKIYQAKCQSCHLPNGQGVPRPDGAGYVYPPLWGPHSYNNGAGLYRLSRFAGYVWANMPLGATADQPMLTHGEAWDLAAYINSQPRPDVRQTVMKHDWPDPKGKPVDHPFGPFADHFSEKQHKFGPFGPLAKRKAP